MEVAESSSAIDNLQNQSAIKSNFKRPLPEDLEPVLLKIDNGKNRNVEDICLHKEEIVIGRARDIDVSILSTFISRNHCRVKLTGENEWSVTNLSSSSTTSINGTEIPFKQSSFLHIGDTLQLSDADDFKYVLTWKNKCHKKTKKMCNQKREIDTEVERQKAEFAVIQAKERKDLEEKLFIEKQKQTNLQGQLEVLLQRQQESEKDDEKLKEQISALEKKIEQGNEAEIELKSKYEQLEIKLAEEKQKFEATLSEEKRKWEEALEKTRKEKETCEAELRAKEVEWQSLMENAKKENQSEQEKLASQKHELEERIKELEKEKENLKNQQPAYAGPSVGLEHDYAGGSTKDSNLEILDTIDLTGDIIEEVTTQPAKKDSVAYDVVNNIMEEQLTCSICSELFVTAVNLNCTHTFCLYCIQSWMKKSRNCPNCRSQIISMNRSLVIDNFIEQMVEKISEEQKQRRKDLVKERQPSTANFKLIIKPNVVFKQRR